MNVIVVAVCVNIALVNANNDIDLDTILRILKGRRYTYHKGTDEPVEAIRIIPGFYLETPKSVSKSSFRHPKTKYNDVYGKFNLDENDRQQEKKTKDSNTRNDHLTPKILKAVKKLDQFRAKKKYEQVEDPNPKTDEKLQVEKLLGRRKPVGTTCTDVRIGNSGEIEKRSLLSSGCNSANFVLGERDIKGFRGSEKYEESIESNPNIGSKKAEKLLVEKLLKNVVNGIKTNNAIEDKQIYKYGTSEDNVWSVEPRYGSVLHKVLYAVQNNNAGKKKRSPLIVVETKPSVSSSQEISNEDVSSDKQITSSSNSDSADETENNAKEILDNLIKDDDDHEDTYYGFHFHTRKNGDEEEIKPCESAATSKEDDSDAEKNPGNPFTIHKNKYRQNWPWNHYMDGDHMNINPFGPQFASLGPSGPELFFGRKWWYFNQDDYKPMG